MGDRLQVLAAHQDGGGQGPQRLFRGGAPLPVGGGQVDQLAGKRQVLDAQLGGGGDGAAGGDRTVVDVGAALGVGIDLQLELGDPVLQVHHVRHGLVLHGARVLGDGGKVLRAHGRLPAHGLQAGGREGEVQARGLEVGAQRAQHGLALGQRLAGGLGLAFKGGEPGAASGLELFVQRGHLGVEHGLAGRGFLDERRVLFHRRAQVLGFALQRPGCQLRTEGRQLGGDKAVELCQFLAEFLVAQLLLGHVGQGVALGAGLLQLAVDAAQVGEVLDGPGRGLHGRRDFQHLVAEELVDALVQALAVLQRAQQRERLVVVDAQAAAELLRERAVHVEGLEAGKGLLQRGRGEAACAVVLQGRGVQHPVAHDVVLADLALEPVGGQVEDRADADVGPQPVLIDQGDGAPAGAGALVERAGLGLEAAAAHVGVGGAPVLAGGGLVRGFVQPRGRVEDVPDAVEKRRLAHAGVAGEQGSGAVDVQGVAAVEGAPVDHLDLGQPVLAGVHCVGERQGHFDAHASSVSSSSSSVSSAPTRSIAAM